MAREVCTILREFSPNWAARPEGSSIFDQPVPHFQHSGKQGRGDALRPDMSMQRDNGLHRMSFGPADNAG